MILVVLELPHPISHWWITARAEGAGGAEAGGLSLPSYLR